MLKKCQAHLEVFMDANEVIKQFGLVPLPEEGGFFRETYRDPGVIPESVLSVGQRAYSTCIYYLITPTEFSGLHAVKFTEIFHFYAGDPVRMVQIESDGQICEFTLGGNLQKKETPQVVVNPGTWQGAKLVPGGKWALLGCTVAPGFEFADYTNGTESELIRAFPQHADIIKAYTHS